MLEITCQIYRKKHFNATFQLFLQILRVYSTLVFDFNALYGG